MRSLISAIALTILGASCAHTKFMVEASDGPESSSDGDGDVSGAGLSFSGSTVDFDSVLLRVGGTYADVTSETQAPDWESNKSSTGLVWKDSYGKVGAATRVFGATSTQVTSTGTKSETRRSNIAVHWIRIRKSHDPFTAARALSRLVLPCALPFLIRQRVRGHLCTQGTRKRNIARLRPCATPSA